MIKQPNELNFTEKKITMIIAGVPGIGKTTLALSAPKPLLVDLDNGVSRVEAKYRQPVLQAANYAELENDLKTEDLSSFESIVIDTGGKLLEFLKPVVIADDAKNGKRDGNLSLQGYGAVKRKFSQFINFVKTLEKHLILIFHATEVNLADDVVGLRIRMEGSSKDEVWDDVDIGGFMEVVGNKRTIGFSNCQRYYAKGTHGVSGIFEIPVLKNGAKNDFLTRLFEEIQNSLNKEVAEVNEYDKIMSENKPIIAAATNVDTINEAFNKITKITHILTSKEELWYALQMKAKELGLTFDAATKQFK